MNEHSALTATVSCVIGAGAVRLRDAGLKTGAPLDAPVSPYWFDSIRIAP